eukprot:7304327-Ditylum_brightwellii.AAC.2
MGRGICDGMELRSEDGKELGVEFLLRVDKQTLGGRILGIPGWIILVNSGCFCRNGIAVDRDTISGGEDYGTMSLHFEERLKRMSSPQMRVKWKGHCWQVLVISKTLSSEPMVHGTQR